MAHEGLVTLPTQLSQNHRLVGYLLKPSIIFLSVISAGTRLPPTSATHPRHQPRNYRVSPDPPVARRRHPSLGQRPR